MTLGEGDEVANLVDSSLIEKKERAPAVIASKHRIEPRKRSRCFSVGRPTPQNRPPPRGKKKILRVDLPTSQTDRYRLVRERGYEQVREKRRRAVTVAVLLRHTCRGGSAQSAGSRAMVDGGGVWRAYPHC